MRKLPKVREDLKTKFKEDQFAREKLNLLQGGDGTGNEGGGDGSTGTWDP